MHQVALALAYLSCTIVTSQKVANSIPCSQAVEVGHQSRSGKLKTLALLLFASDPRVAFNPSGHGAAFSAGSRTTSQRQPTASAAQHHMGRNIQIKGIPDRFGSGSPMMNVAEDWLESLKERQKESYTEHLKKKWKENWRLSSGYQFYELRKSRFIGDRDTFRKNGIESKSPDPEEDYPGFDDAVIRPKHGRRWQKRRDRYSEMIKVGGAEGYQLEKAKENLAAKFSAYILCRNKEGRIEARLQADEDCELCAEEGCFV